MTNPDFLVVTTTHENEAKARALATAAVRARLAACAQVYPIHSVYWWDGAVQSSAEWRIDFKTRAALGPQLTAFVGEQHDYDTPEVLALPVASGSSAYLDWLATETRDS
jgi:periplasmic divalent cation tolerance protein